MTIYRNLSWERLSELLDNFNLSTETNKQFKLNGIIVFCNMIDVWPTHIECYEQGWEYTQAYDEEWDDLHYSRDIIKYEIDKDCKFDLVVDWYWFEIKALDK